MLSNALYNAANALYGTFGAGKRLDEKSGAVLIIGGSSDGLLLWLPNTIDLFLVEIYPMPILYWKL